MAVNKPVRTVDVICGQKDSRRSFSCELSRWRNHARRGRRLIWLASCSAKSIARSLEVMHVIHVIIVMHSHNR